MSAPSTPQLERIIHRQRRRRVLVHVLRAAIVVTALASWELLSGDPREGFALIDEFYVSRPSAMLETVGVWMERDHLVPNILATLQVTLLGFGLGAAGGILVGFVLGVSDFWSRVLNPFVATLYSVPRLALIPLFLMWFGLGLGPKLAMVIVIVFFLVFYNTFSGVRDVDQQLIDVLRVMQGRAWQIHTRVTLPSAMVWIVTGLRVSVPYALVAAVTAEMLTSNQGMGYVIIRAAGQFNTAGVFAGIVILMAMALMLTGLVGALEKRLLRWKPAGREALGGAL
jgi:NitT/TauT family transport system permease protein